ncbi:NADPH-dependent D-xylose reductase, partial [Taenia solium]
MSSKWRRDEPLDVYDPTTDAFERRKLGDTWKAMEELVSGGLVRSIGVTNFVKRQLRWVLGQCTIGPVVVQVEANVHFPNRRLIE